MTRILLTVLSALSIACVVSAQTPNILEEVDRLYLQRDERPKAKSALEILERELSAKPNDDEILWRMARALKWEGDLKSESSEKIGFYKRAVEMAKKGVEANPLSVASHFWLGVGWGKIGQTQGVLRSLFLVDPIKKEMETVLSLDPNNDGAHLVLGVMYRKLPGFWGGSTKRSMEELKRAVSERPNSTLNRLELANTYLEERKKQEAMSELQSILAIFDPVDPVEARKDKEEAQQMLSNIH